MCAAPRPNPVQTGRRCVCPHPKQEQVHVRVSALILPQAFPPVFLSLSLFYLSLCDYCHCGCLKKKRKKERKNTSRGKCRRGVELGRGSTTELRWLGGSGGGGEGYKAPRVGIGFW